MSNHTLIYHGSNMTVKPPKIMINGHYKDFGYGFYSTNLRKQAVRWAMTKPGKSIINLYSYEENQNLSVKKIHRDDRGMASVCGRLQKRNRT